MELTQEQVERKTVDFYINSLKFRDLNTYVSSFSGLLDKLKPKARDTYNWSEYNGTQIDLSKTYYEPREIILDCFIIGNDWQETKQNFDILLSEFEKQNEQRLTIEAVGLKPLIYQVYLNDKVVLSHGLGRNTEGAKFQLKLIEPNPIKKVFKVKDDGVYFLAFYSEKYVSIFQENEKRIEKEKGTFEPVIVEGFLPKKVSENHVKELNSYNIFYNSNLKEAPAKKTKYVAILELEEFNTEKQTLYLIGRNKKTSKYECLESLEVLIFQKKVHFVFSVDISKYGKLIFKLYNENKTDFKISKVEIKEILEEKIPVDQKYIVLAGDIDETYIYKSNLEEVWSKL